MIHDSLLFDSVTEVYEVKILRKHHKSLRLGIRGEATEEAELQHRGFFHCDRTREAAGEFVQSQLDNVGEKDVRRDRRS